MTARTAVTIGRPREEVMRRWQAFEHPDYVLGADAAVSFLDAPGGRGTEVHVDLERQTRGGMFGEVVQKLTGSDPLARVKDDLRRFKQTVETGEIARSDASPAGESAARKLRQRPAQPLDEQELQQAGLR